MSPGKPTSIKTNLMLHLVPMFSSPKRVTRKSNYSISCLMAYCSPKRLTTAKRRSTEQEELNFEQF